MLSVYSLGSQTAADGKTRDSNLNMEYFYLHF
jgi:hypothetical protein